MDKRTLVPSNKLLIISLILPLGLVLVHLIDRSSALRIVEKDESLIKSACSSTKHPALCVSILRSDPRSSSTADSIGLARIVMELAASKATEIQDIVHQLGANATDASLKKCFDECYGLYEGIPSGLDIAMYCLDQREYVCIDQKIVSAGSKSEDCERAFAKNKRKSPLTKKNQLMGNLLEIVKGLLGPLD